MASSFLPALLLCKGHLSHPPKKLKIKTPILVQKSCILMTVPWEESPFHITTQSIQLASNGAMLQDAESRVEKPNVNPKRKSIGFQSDPPWRNVTTATKTQRYISRESRGETKAHPTLNKDVMIMDSLDMNLHTQKHLLELIVVGYSKKPLHRKE